MKTILSILILSLAIATQAQVVSKFTWTSLPLTKADFGPNGLSVSSSAVTQNIGGTLGYAVNPGLPTKNLDLVIPGSPYFDIPAIDIDLYFRREESVASFFKRGSLMEFGMDNGSLYVKFTTTQGSNPVALTISSGNIATVADDHIFHHYRFKYDNNAGIANVWVDDVIKYTYTGFAGRPLSWTGAGNVIVGEQMDATSRNIAILANLTIQNPSSSVLPLELISFTAKENNGSALLQWNTTREMNTDHFVIERSADALKFATLKTVAASGSYTSVHQYRENDAAPSKGVNYYRLKMVDADGKFSYSEIVKLNLNANTSTIHCFPNPVTNYVSISISNASAGAYDYSVSTMDGRIVKAASVDLKSGAQQVKIDLSSNTPSGVLIIRLRNNNTNETETFKIVKQ